MVVFNTDMDNTIIYSYKHDIGENKRCVELYQGREITFITDKTRQLLNKMAEDILIVPTTTRTIEQYKRLALGVNNIKYALVCNGGVLLVDGKEDINWYRQSLKLIAESENELKKARKLLEEDKNISFDVRNINELFIFTKSDNTELTVKMLQSSLDDSLVDIFCNGPKVYVVPKQLSKGNAVKRLKQYLGADVVIAAGDSDFDVSMFEVADVAITPFDNAGDELFSERVVTIVNELLLSKEVLKARRKKM